MKRITGVTLLYAFGILTGYCIIAWLYTEDWSYLLDSLMFAMAAKFIDMELAKDEEEKER